MLLPRLPPPGVKRLFDLVKCRDERLRPAFYYALRDTLAATDLEQASRIAYGQNRRWRRVVTLKVGDWGMQKADGLVLPPVAT
jgi:chromosome segregation ATPase